MSVASCNPTVNRYLSNKAMDHIDHALGRPIFPLRESYRNYFAVEPGGELATSFDASTYWRRRNVVPGGLVYYSVTEEGRAALAKHLALLADRHHAYEIRYAGYTRIVPALSRAKACYSYFLTISDVDADLRFRDFVKKCTVRRAA